MMRPIHLRLSALCLPLFFGGERLVALVGTTRTRTASRERDCFPPPRQRGRGTTGARVASEPWWRGRMTRSLVVVADCLFAEEASEHVWASRRLLRRVEACAPSTTLLRRVVPLPRYRGGG